MQDEPEGSALPDADRPNADREGKPSPACERRGLVYARVNTPLRQENDGL